MLLSAQIILFRSPNAEVLFLYWARLFVCIRLMNNDHYCEIYYKSWIQVIDYQYS